MSLSLYDYDYEIEIVRGKFLKKHNSNTCIEAHTSLTFLFFFQ